MWERDCAFLKCDFYKSLWFLLVDWAADHIFNTHLLFHKVECTLISVYRLEITVPVGWALNTNK